jgi:hypothetical protein
MTKVSDSVDMAFLNESILFHFLGEALPQILIQTTNSFLTHTLSDAAFFSITLSFLTALNGVYKYWYYIFCLGKTVADVPGSIELPSIYNVMDFTRKESNPMHNVESVSVTRIVEYGKPEEAAWKILLKCGIEDVIQILIENKIGSFRDLKSADTTTKELLLHKYKEKKTDQEYQDLKQLLLDDDEPKSLV